MHCLHAWMKCYLFYVTLLCCMQDILLNNVIKLDNNFKHSFIYDLLTVLSYTCCCICKPIQVVPIGLLTNYNYFSR